MAFPWDGGQQRYTTPAEARIARQNAESDRMADIEKFSKQRVVQAEVIDGDKRIAARRRRNEQAMRASEAILEQNTAKAAQFERQRARRLAQDEAIAIELERRKRESDSRRKEVQRICEQDEELRQLQEMLKQAYANKELARQKEETEAARKEEQQQNAAMEAAMEKERVRLLEEQQRKEHEAAQRKRADAAVVKDQIRYREMQRFVEGEEEAARERAQVDAVVQAVQAEEEKAAAARRAKQSETRYFIDEFKHQREAHLESQREAEREAERAERAHLEAQAAHRDRVAAAKNADLAAKQAAYQKIVQEQEAARRAQDEEDRLRWVIVEEEAQKKARDEAARRDAATVQGRKEMREAVEAQKRLQEQQRAEEAAREAELVRQFLDRVAADEEAAAEAKRRQLEAAKHFKAGIEEQKGQRMHAYAQQRAAEDRAVAEAAAREEYRLKVVQEARRRLLEEHAAALEGYLPKGVFKSEEDLEVVRRARGQQ